MIAQHCITYITYLEGKLPDKLHEGPATNLGIGYVVHMFLKMVLAVS
jgi:hypothetical protein